MADRALTRVHSLRERLDVTLSAHRNEIVALLSRYKTSQIIIVSMITKGFLLNVSKHAKRPFWKFKVANVREVVDIAGL